MTQTHYSNELQETVRAIQHLLAGHLDLQLDRTQLNGYLMIVESLRHALASSPAHFQEVLASILSDDPLLRQALAAGTEMPERKYWYEEDELHLVPQPRVLLKRYGMSLPDKAVSLLIGDPGIGKSFMALDLALMAAQTMRVLYLAAEKFPLNRDRVDAWYQHHGLKSQRHLQFYDGRLILQHEAALSAWIDQVKGQGKPLPCLVIIDTVARCLDGDENSAEVMRGFSAGCDRIQREFDCAVLGVHHHGKDSSKGARGHNSLSCAVDAILELKRDGKLLTITNSKLNGWAEFEPVQFKLLTVTIDPDTGDDVQSCVIVPTGAAVPVEVSVPASHLALLRVLNRSAVALQPYELVTLTGLAKSTVSTVMNKLAATCYADKTDDLKAWQITAEGMSYLYELDPAAERDTAA